MAVGAARRDGLAVEEHAFQLDVQFAAAEEAVEATCRDGGGAAVVGLIAEVIMRPCECRCPVRQYCTSAGLPPVPQGATHCTEWVNVCPSALLLAITWTCGRLWFIKCVCTAV